MPNTPRGWPPTTCGPASIAQRNPTAMTPDVIAEHRFFEISLDLFCYADFKGYFAHLNPAWERTLGYTIAELQSRPMIEFVHPDDRERTLAKNEEVRAGGVAVAFENRYLRKDGTARWFLWNAVSDLQREVIYSVARDITERKRAEDERERLVTQLQAALDEVRTLQEILPICSYCKKVRDDTDYWQSVEGYLAAHTSTRFSHGICPACYTTNVTPLLEELDRDG